MKKIFVILMAMAAIFSLMGNASASTITTTAVKSLSPTNFDVGLDVNYFDSTLGVLLSVQIKLTGSILGNIEIESKDAAATTIETELSAVIKLSKPSGGDLVTVLPIHSETFDAAAYDGITDFGGTSGKTYLNLSATNYDTAYLTSADNLSFFSNAGGGILSLDLTATGASKASGAGNLVASFVTQASGSVEIIYTYYTTEVPEPATFMLLGLGIFGLGGILRRKFRQA